SVATLFRAVVQNGSCAPAASAPGAVSMNAVPSAAITAPADVCPLSRGNAASVPDAGPGAVYFWEISGGTITSGAGTRAIIFTAASGTVSLTASVQSAAGCTGSGNATAPLKTPAASIQAPTSACPGATGLVASVEPDPGAGAITFWTISNGLITDGLGTRTITFQPTGASPVTLEALVAQSGCLQDVLATVPVAPCTSPGAFHPLPPCRVADTRGADGALGGPALAPGETRVLPLSASSCGVPANASAVSLNVTTIASGDGALSLGAGDEPAPATEMLPLVSGRTRAVQSIVRLATDGSGRIVVFNDSTGSLHLVLDVSGTFE
ncbi:MAG TPA: hypothetical protein VMN04_05440, partial [Thermoanaerobaculia bacterium]|nr:hypothetical protein [Thermoanaerobaculia bacterium]